MISYMDLAKAILLTSILSILLGLVIIPQLRKAHIGQHIREDGPKSHFSKQGTPTMGGIIFVISLLIGLVVFRSTSPTIGILLFGTLGFGLIGFLDDFFKLVMKRSLGLTEKQKLLLQVLISILMIYLYQMFHPEASLQIQKLPFFGVNLDLGWLTYPILAFILVGSANATNLTDGLDGLATGISIPVFLAIAVIGYSVNQEVSLFSALMTGALIGFLIFNSNPAAVFMGDTGSMAIGGALATASMIIGISLYLPILGAIFMIEVLSDIIQVTSYKTRHGKRVFLMAPIHHHFELRGYAEQKIVTTFSVISILLSVITLIDYFSM